MSVTLEIDFAGVHLPNPFILSSAPPTTTPEMIERAFELGWGGAVIKTLAFDISLVQNVEPRIYGVKVDGQLIGFSNLELGSARLVDVWVKDIKYLKKKFPENALFVSMLHAEGLIKNQWVEVANKCAEAGVDGLELNFSCSHGMAEGGGGAVVGGNVQLIQQVISWVKEATDIPIMVKLPAIVENLPHKAQVAKESGAGAISAINTLNCLPEVDIYTFIPYPQVDGKSAFGGLSGPAIKPVGLYCVAQIAQKVDIPISGIGGITTWEDAAQYFLVGATSVQLCSSVMRYGYRIIEDLTQGLQNYMHEMSFQSITDFSGLALPNIVKHKQLNRDYKLVCRIDLDKCTLCGLCSIVCDNSAYQAIRMSDNRTPEIDEEKCDGCGLCIQICPVHGCMSLAVRHV